MFSSKSSSVQFPMAPIVSQGTFWKKGQSSMVTSWKFRRYEIQENGQLLYFDLGSNQAPKGNIDISDIFIYDGPQENVTAVDKSNSKKRFSVSLKSQKDSRVLEVVFDSIDDLTVFVEGITKLGMTSNVVTYSASKGLTLIQNANATKRRPMEESSEVAALMSVTSANSSSTASTAMSTTFVTPGEQSKRSHFSMFGHSKRTSGGGKELFMESNDEIEGQGRFFKLGSNVKNWKSRKYVIVRRASGPVLLYFDPDSDVASEMAKGSLNLTNIHLSLDATSYTQTFLFSNAVLLQEGASLKITSTDPQSGQDGLSIPHANSFSSSASPSSPSDNNESAAIFGEKELTLVFSKRDEALVFVNQLSHVSTNNNCDWFRDEVLAPIRTAQPTTKTPPPGSVSFKAVDYIGKDISENSTGLRNRKEVLASHALAVSIPNEITNGIFLKLKVGLKKAWRTRVYEIHQGKHMFSYQSEAVTGAGSTLSQSSEPKLGMKHKNLDHHLVNVSLVETKALLDDAVITASVQSRRLSASNTISSVETNSSSQDAESIAKALSVFQMAMRIEFVPTEESNSNAANVAKTGRRFSSFAALSTKPKTSPEILCMCIPSKYYDGTLNVPTILLTGAYTSSPGSVEAKEEADWEDMVDAASTANSIEFLTNLMNASPNNNILPFLEKLKQLRSLRATYVDTVLQVKSVKESPLKEAKPSQADLSKEIVDSIFKSESGAMYSITSLVWVIWMFYISFYPTAYSLFLFCSFTCGLVLLFRYISSGGELTDLVDIVLSVPSKNSTSFVKNSSVAIGSRTSSKSKLQ